MPKATHPNAAAFPPGMSGPSLRALANAGIRSMAEVKRWSEAELLEMHGMGPKGVALLQSSPKGAGKSLKREK